MEVDRLMLIFVVLMSLISLSSETETEPQFTAMFVFGDSLVDPGNNIHFDNSFAKANFWPYGVDSDNGPTGRFCNGKILVDFLGELLGIPPIPAYAETIANGTNILSGVNYASAGAGILRDTGYLFGRVIPLAEQIDNFKSTLNQLSHQMQSEEISAYLAKAVVFMNIGANDYLNNYLLPGLYTSSHTYTPQQFVDLLIKLFMQYILEIQGLGVRKFLIAEISPIGCIPAKLREVAPSGECVSTDNDLVQMFNSRLKSLVYGLNSDNPGSLFTLAASFQLFTHLRDNADAYGFKVKDTACCGIGKNKGSKLLCVLDQVPCFNRDEYLFWDAAHPTEAANRIIARQVYDNASYCFPFTLQQMAKM